jgi:hypothetical protein
VVWILAAELLAHDPVDVVGNLRRRARELDLSECVEDSVEHCFLAALVGPGQPRRA